MCQVRIVCEKKTEHFHSTICYKRDDDHTAQMVFDLIKLCIAILLMQTQSPNIGVVNKVLVVSQIAIRPKMQEK